MSAPNLPESTIARANLLRRVNGVISDLQSAVSELRRTRGLAADEQIRRINTTIKNYEDLRSSINRLR